MRGNDRISVPALEPQEQLLPRPHLDVAGRADIETDGPRQIDVEAGKDTLVVIIVERRKVPVGEEAHDDPPRLVLSGACFRRSIGILAEHGRSRGGQQASDREQNRNTTGGQAPQGPPMARTACCYSPRQPHLNALCHLPP